MPTSLDPPLGDDEIECARCGARFYDGLTRCPNCGVNLYEPDENSLTDNPRHAPGRKPHKQGWLDKAEAALHRLTGKPYRAEDVFGDALNQASLYNDLLAKVGGDTAVVDRLIDYERQLNPQGTRSAWLQAAIQSWEKDNQTRDSGRVI